MKADELFRQPDGVLFYEDDLPGPVVFQKVYSIENDLIVRQFDADFEQSRLGLREMDDTTRNSKDYHVFSKDELDTFTEFLTLAHLASE